MHLRTTLSQRSVISHCKRRLQGIPLMRAYVWCSALNFKDIFILAVRETWGTDTFRVRSTVMFQTLVSRIEQSVPAPSHASIPVLRVFRGFIKQQTLPNLSEKPTSSISKEKWSPNLSCAAENSWAMVNTHYMVDGHPIHNKDPYNGYYKSLWTIGWLAPINGY